MRIPRLREQGRHATVYDMHMRLFATPGEAVLSFRYCVHVIVSDGKDSL